MTMSESVRSDDVPNAANPGTDTGESVEGSNAAVNTPALQARLNAITAANPKLLMAQEALIDALAPGNPESVGWVLDLPRGDLADLLRNMRLYAIEYAEGIYDSIKSITKELRRSLENAPTMRAALGLGKPDSALAMVAEGMTLSTLAEDDQKTIFEQIAAVVVSGRPSFGSGTLPSKWKDVPVKMGEQTTEYPNPLSAPAVAFHLGEEFQWFDTGSIRNGGFPERLSPDVSQVAHFLQKEHGDCTRSAEGDFALYRAVLMHTRLVGLQQLPTLTEEEHEIFDSALRRYLGSKSASSTVDTSWRDYLEKYSDMQKKFDAIANSLARTPQRDLEPSTTPTSTPSAERKGSIQLNKLPGFEGLETFMRCAMHFIQDLSIITQVHEGCKGQWSEESVRTVEERLGQPSGDNEGLAEIIDAVLGALPDTYTEAFTAMKNYCTERGNARENHAAINKVYGI